MSVNSLFSPAGAMDGTLLLAAATTFSFSLAIVVIAIPGLLRKMREGGMVGRDVNKSTKHEVPELGGIAALFGFTISLSIIVGVQKIVGDIAEPPYLAAISVFFIAAMVGLIDRKSTRLNSSHLGISYAVFCLKKRNIRLVRAPRRCRAVAAAVVPVHVAPH